MCTGRISASSGILTSPISGSPCVAYLYEVSEYCFTGNIITGGWGFKRIYSEKKSLSYEICDPNDPNVKVQVDAQDEIINGSKKAKTKNGISFEYLTDVALAHLCPIPAYSYDVPKVVDGEIEATENLIRGYPLKFGMLDGEGTNTRVEIPESIERIMDTLKIKLVDDDNWLMSLKKKLKLVDEEEVSYRTFALTEMCLRVNDQVNMIATFETIPDSNRTFRAKPV